MIMMLCCLPLLYICCSWLYALCSGAVCLPLLLLLALHLLGTHRFLPLPSAGPCLPFIGHLHLLSSREGREDPVNHLWKLYQKHSRAGMLWTRLLNQDILHVGDFDTIKYIFNHPDAQDRFLPWTHLRQFTLKTLKDFGLSSSSMNDVIQGEVKLFLDHLKQFGDEPQNLAMKLNLPMLNSVLNVAVGHRFDYDDPTALSLLPAMDKMVRKYYYPENLENLTKSWLKWMFPIMETFGRNERIFSGWSVSKQPKENKQDTEMSSLPSTDIKNFLDMFLVQLEQTNDTSYKVYGAEGREQLATTIFDLFAVGSETTCTALSWAMVHMLRHPEVQKTVQEELDRVVGRDRLPAMADRPSLPYTQVWLPQISSIITQDNSTLFIIAGHTHGSSALLQPASQRSAPLLYERRHAQRSDYPGQHHHPWALHRSHEGWIAR